MHPLKAGIKRNRAGDIAMIQSLYTTGRIPLNHKLDTHTTLGGHHPAFCSEYQMSKSEKSGEQKVEPMGVDVGDVLVKTHNTSQSHDMGRFGHASSGDSFVFSSLSSCQIHKDCCVTPGAASDSKDDALKLKERMSQVLDIKFMGISETSIAAANIGKSDMSIASIVNGSVTLVCDEHISPGKLVCIAYPWHNLNKKVVAGGMGNVAQNRQKGPKLTPSKMRILSYESEDLDKNDEKFCCVIPIGQCVRGSSDAGDLIQVRLFTGLH